MSIPEGALDPSLPCSNINTHPPLSPASHPECLSLASPGSGHSILKADGKGPQEWLQPSTDM
jgi:hypothetical protein